MRKTIKKDNHFVPRMYLKNWATDGSVQIYRTLVQHENVPMWKPFPLKGIGYLKYLYVNTQDGKECDSLEVWFDEHYENPAEVSIAKVISNSKLSSLDYRNLINFFALQDLRTPKKFIEYLNKDNQKEFQTGLKKVVDKVMAKGVPKGFEPSEEVRFHDEFPLKLIITKQENGLLINFERLVGRASWLWGIKHLLNTVVGHLHKHKWTILQPAKGMTWFTSDNPTLKLNNYSNGSYDFKGGWGNNGTELMLPLSPQHLLYTNVGVDSSLQCGTRVSVEKTRLVNRLIIENCHRYVISKDNDLHISNLHDRVVSTEDVKHELEQWKSMHEKQAKSEREFYSAKYT